MNVLIVGARGAGKDYPDPAGPGVLGRPVSEFETEKRRRSRSIFMMRWRSMCPQRRIWWACAERPVGFR